MGGCIVLLQSWALYRMSFIQPRDSFNQGSSANHHIHLQLGKQKFLTQINTIFINVFDTNILHFIKWNGRGL